MRRGFNYLGVGTCFFGNLSHHADEVIECFIGLCFGWFYHEGFVYDQWEVDGWRVHAEVEDTLGNVEGCDSMLILLALRRCNELMLADLWKGNFIVRG